MAPGLLPRPPAGAGTGTPAAAGAAARTGRLAAFHWQTAVLAVPLGHQASCETSRNSIGSRVIRPRAEACLPGPRMTDVLFFWVTRDEFWRAR